MQEEDGEEDDLIPALATLLRKQRGTVLRAWRLDFDRLKTGRLTFADFAQACRKLGFPDEARLLWTALRPRDGLLELYDLEPTEAINVDKLLDCFWTDAGYDLDDAWCGIDTRRRQAISIEEFAAGLKRLGFKGDCKLLFRGLDADGFGKLWRRDFDYLKILALGPANGHKAMPDLQVFVRWTRKEFESPSGFLDMLNLSKDPCTGPIHRPSETFSMQELIARLTALGYPGEFSLSAGGLDAEGLRALLQSEEPELRAWAVEEHGGVDELLEALWPELQSGAAERRARKHTDVDVADFAERLTALGYEGDSRRAAVAVAKACDARRVSGRALHKFLEDQPLEVPTAKPTATPANDRPRGRSPARSISPVRRPNVERQQARASPTQTERHNAQIPRGRATTDAPQRGRATSEGRDGLERASSPAARAPWDSTIDLTSEKNRRLHVFSRSYFGFGDAKLLRPTFMT